MEMDDGVPKQFSNIERNKRELKKIDRQNQKDYRIGHKRAMSYYSRQIKMVII